MKRFALRGAAFAALFALGGLASAAEPIAVRLIGINDFHGHLESTGLSLLLADPQASGPDAKPLRVPVGGAAALAGLVKTLRASAPNSVMVSAGDLIGAAPLVSSLFKHESTVEIMNSIGLDVGSVGNHEFDAGLTELLRVVKGGCAPTSPVAVASSCALGPYPGMHFPLLAANVLYGPGKPVLAPYAILRRGGVRIGFIGVVTKTLPSLVSPSGIAGLVIDDEADAVNRAARQLKARGVRAIVAVFHEGGAIGTSQRPADWNDTSCPNASGPIFGIAQRLVPDISVVMSAHTHKGYRCLIDGRTIISGTLYGQGVSVVDLKIDRKTRRILPALTQSRNLPVFNELTDPAVRERLISATPAPWAEPLREAVPDAAIAARVANFAQIVAPKAERAIGTVGGPFPRGGRVDSPAGRLVADAQLAATAPASEGSAQVAFMNPFGIRSDLECAGSLPCTVTFGQVFTMQPFGNSLVVMTLTGAQIKGLLEQQARPAGTDPMLLQPSAGFSYAWLDDAPAGEHASDLRLDGEPIDLNKRYRITVNSFLAEGGDGFVLLKQGADKKGGGQDLDALVDYLKPPAQRAPIPTPRVTRLP